MLSHILADLVVVIHLLFIVFALLGALLGLWRPWLVLVHLPTAVWIAVVELQSRNCPLTPLENRLRHAAGQQGYEGGFIDHYLMPIIYPPGLTRDMQMVLGSVAVGVNVAVYVFVVWRWRKAARSSGDSQDPDQIN